VPLSRLAPALVLAALLPACHQATPGASATDASAGKAPVTGLLGAPSFEDLFRRASPSVVNVSAAHPLPIPNQLLSKRAEKIWRALVRSLGSGFVFDSHGHLATCSSVIQDATEVEVILASGRHLQAQVVAVDEASDLAVLAIPEEQAPAPLPLAPAGSLRAGDWVAAFGYPYGLANTITGGMVSAIRSAEAMHTAHGLILSDAAVNPGCNGGPLVDAQGRVVGINLIGGQPEGGVGLAVPISDALPVLELLKKGQHPRQPWLGLAVQALDSTLAAAFGLPGPEGALITRVQEDSPASRAGIRPGDVILSFGERPVADPLGLIEALRAAALDKPISLGMFRDGKRIALPIVPGPMP
jgi:serine protease Do